MSFDCEYLEDRNRSSDRMCEIKSEQLLVMTYCFLMIASVEIYFRN